MALLDPSTIRRYMVTWKGGGLPLSTWSTFLASHVSELWTIAYYNQGRPHLLGGLHQDYRLAA